MIFKGMFYMDHVTKPVLRTIFSLSKFKIIIKNKTGIIWENDNKGK